MHVLRPVNSICFSSASLWSVVLIRSVIQVQEYFNVAKERYKDQCRNIVERQSDTDTMQQHFTLQFMLCSP
ncbi:hypothetical protein VPH35_072818 [Triticum aestivum]